MKLSEITFEMVQDSLNGSTKATEKIYNAILRLTKYQIFLRLKRENIQSQEDIAQDVAIKIIMNLGKFTPDHKFATWVFAVIKNSIIDFARKSRLDTLSIQGAFNIEHDDMNSGRIDFQIEDKSMTQDELINNMETKKFVHTLFKSELFSQKQKMVMKLRFIDDKSYTEIVEETGFKLNTVKGLIHRVRETVKGQADLKAQSSRLLSK